MQKFFLIIFLGILFLSIEINCFALDGASTDFNGSTSIVPIESCSHLNDIDTFTWCIWENHDNDGEATNGRIINKNTSSERLWFMSAGEYDITINTSGTDAISRNENGSTPPNVWKWSCVTYDDSGDRKIRIYLDGVETASYSIQAAASGTINSDASVVFTFGNHTTSIRTFDGQLVYPHIYSRVISTDEMIELMHRPCSILNGLEGCWDSTMTINLVNSCGLGTHTATAANADSPDVQLTAEDG